MAKPPCAGPNERVLELSQRPHVPAEPVLRPHREAARATAGVAVVVGDPVTIRAADDASGAVRAGRLEGDGAKPRRR